MIRRLGGLEVETIAMHNIRCGNCGTAIPATATFCPRCGITLQAPDDRTAPRGTAPRPVLPHTPPGRSSWRLLLPLLVLFLPALALVVIVVPRHAAPVRVATPQVFAPPPAMPRPPFAPMAPVAPPQKAVAVLPAKLPLAQPRRSFMAEIDEPTLPRGGEAVVLLPEPWDAYRVGGGGRYHLFHLPRAGRLAVFDVSAAAVVKQIPIGPNAKFAAGMTHFVVVDEEQNLINRYSFKRLQVDRVAQMPGSGTVRGVLMAPSDDKVYLTRENATYTFSVTDMRPDGDPEPIPGFGTNLDGLSLSLDGQLGLLGPYHVTLAWGRRTVTAKVDRPADAPGWHHPSTDGTLVFDGGGLFTREGTSAGINLGAGECLASVDPRFFWFAPAAAQSGPADLSLYVTTDRRRLFTLHLPASVTSAKVWPFPHFDGTQTFWHLPQANVVVFTLADRIVLRHFDLIEELQKSGTNYLFVQSMPVERAQRGFLYVYSVDTRSKAGGVKYRLVSGPKGLSVNPNAGVIHWTVPADFDDADRVDIKIGVTDDAGGDIVHQFEVYLTD